MKRKLMLFLITIIITFSMTVGLTASAAQTLQSDVVLGKPGLSYRYISTLGVTGVPYLTDVSHLNYPLGISIDGMDNMFVVEENGQRLLGYDSAGNNFLAIGHAGVPMNTAGYLNFPHDVTMDMNSNFWVATNNAVYTFDPTGNQLAFTPQDPWNAGSDEYHFNNPLGIAFDHDGYLFVSDFNNQRVQVYSIDNFTLTYVNTIGETGVPDKDNMHFNMPGGIAFDSSNALYVVDGSNNRIQKCISSDHWYSWSCTTFFGGAQGSDPSNGELGWSIGITIDGADNIFIADGTNYRVLKCTPAGVCTHFVGTVGEPGNDNNHFEFIGDVAVDSSGQIYVSDPRNMRVQVFTTDGTYIKTIGNTDVPYLVDDHHYNQPWGVAIANNGGLYISENAGCRLIKLNPDGSQAWTTGQAGLCGSGTNQIGYSSYWGDNGNPIEVNGKVLMPDNVNNRIQIFDANTGVLLSTFGEYGQGEKQFSGPYDITINPSNQDILIADDGNSRVQVFTSDWDYKTTIGETRIPGDDDTHFNRPKGVAVDANGAVYVADSENFRIQKCTTSDSLAYTCTTLITGNGDWNTTSLDQLHPENVAVDAFGKLYVTSDWYNKVQVYDANGAFLTSFGMRCNTESAGLCYPEVSAVDAQGNVYIADLMNNRIQKYAPGVPGWKQVNINGFGNPTTSTVALRSFKGQLYAGAGDWNTGVQIWRSSVGVSWNQVTTPGEGLGAYSGVVLGIGVFKGKLYVGTAWGGSPPELWRTTDGTDWTQVLNSDPGAAAFDAIGVFNNQIYAAVSYYSGTEGVTIYRSDSGNPGTWSAIITNGNGDENNDTIRDFAVFNDRFYAVGSNPVVGGFVWRLKNGTWEQVNTSGFGDMTLYAAQSIAVFNDTLYVGTKCGTSSCVNEIWKTSNGTQWSRVPANFSQAGYGDITSLYTFNGALYAVVAGGNTIWRTLDGKTWQQVNIAGWGDSNNQWSMFDYAITSFNGHLYIGTNDNSPSGWGLRGTQVWQYLPH